MREINQLIYNRIKSDDTFKSLTGATTRDPRIYKQRTPVKLPVTDAKKSYVIYRLMGSTKPGDWVHGSQRNNLTYGLEIYSKVATNLDEVCDRIQVLFEDQSLTTTSYLVKFTYAVRGSQSFDDGRQLYFEAMMLHLNNVYDR